MGVFSGPDVSESGLVLALDAGNRKTFANSVINSISWSLGSGGATGYSQNGSTVENERVTGTDPFGRSATVWETRPTGTTDADGGWNSDWYNIDNTKLYRFSVWVKRTTSTSGGTFYLGLYGNASGIRRTDNNTVEGNPYWECSGTSKFTQDVWYLVVGHCYPHNTTYTGQHPETGIYTVAGGATKVLSINACNIGTDVKWAGSDVTQTIHRCYHYYCSDSTTRLQLFDPRIDAIDGTEPSIINLLSGFTASRLSDLIGTNNGTFVNSPTYNSSNGGSIVFDGTDDRVECGTWSVPYITVSTWVYKTSSATNQGICRKETGWAVSQYNGTLQVAPGTSWTFYNTGYTIPLNTWVNIVYTYSGTGTAGSQNVYINGSSIYNTSAGSGAISANSNAVRIGYDDNNWFWGGRIGQTQIYNRALTASEIQQNFNANRSKFGI